MSSPARKMTKAEVLRRIRGLPKDQRNPVVCALVGHSRIHEYSFGYIHCARCGAQVGDVLMGDYPDRQATVIVSHAHCATCQRAAAAFTWRDSLYAPNLFTKTAEEGAA